MGNIEVFESEMGAMQRYAKTSSLFLFVFQKVAV